MPDPTHAVIQHMLDTVWYEDSSKHKLHPHLFGLEPSNSEKEQRHPV